MSALNKSQKRELSQMFDRAFNRAAALARGRGESADDCTKARAAYRHTEVARAVNKAGLRCCSQADYAAIKAHALSLLGEDGQAMNWHVRAASNPTRQWEFKIDRLCKLMNLRLAYADGICLRQTRGLHLLEASPAQLAKVHAALRYHFKNTHGHWPNESAA